ncbi:MAG: 16S rRNA (uracil(1498)-N(3))-methyltransferase [Desulfobulbaceae bacterium]|nr:16S rRNA (uracil(1498)-N(3))-methyltransferase [Desulfobulbaceae bacterium]
MNLLLFESHELAGSLLKLTGRRAEHIIRVLELGRDDTVKVGMLNGKTGIARVVGISGDTVDLDVHLTETVPDEPAIELILALPRPIMLQRILKQATVLGVRRFHLIRSSRVQKSFFQASLLQPDKMKEILMQGLEQTVDTRLPEVCVHHRFLPFVEDVVPALTPACRLLAHPPSAATLPDLYAADRIFAGFVLAIGPEGGWSPHEVDSFGRQGFNPFSMGRRILHVDTAVVALLSQLRLLLELNASRKKITG